MSNLRFNYLYVLQIIVLNNDLYKISNTYNIWSSIPTMFYKL